MVERRTVTKTATVSLHGNTYEVDPALAGRKVELVFDPFDLTTHRGPLAGPAAGQAVPLLIGRHVHPKARPDDRPARRRRRPGSTTCGLVEAQHTADLAERRAVLQLAGLTSRPTGRPGERRLPGIDARPARTAARCPRDRQTAAPTTGSPGCRSAGTWRRGCCTATARTPRRSPGSAGASASASA